MLADRRSLPRRCPGQRNTCGEVARPGRLPACVSAAAGAGITFVRRTPVMKCWTATIGREGHDRQPWAPSRRRRPCLLPVSRGTADTVLAALLAAVAESVASGTWDRLKICRNPGLPVGLFRPLKEPVTGLVLDGRVRQPGQGQGLPQPQPQPPMAGVSRGSIRAGLARVTGWRG